MKCNLLLAAGLSLTGLSLAFSAPASAAGPEQGRWSFSLLGGIDTPATTASTTWPARTGWSSATA